MLTGVVEVGLFCGMAKAAYFGNEVCFFTALGPFILPHFRHHTMVWLPPLFVLFLVNLVTYFLTSCFHTHLPLYNFRMDQ